MKCGLVLPSLNTRGRRMGSDSMGSSRSNLVAPTTGRLADPEVRDRPVRRAFTAQYKADILAETDRAEAGKIGEILRREGLYSSHLCTWRRHRTEGMKAGLMPKKRGKKARQDPLDAEIQRLRRENDLLQRRLKDAELIIEFQKKVSQILEIPLRDPPASGTS